jgi:calcineurin-like phosphoesterase family protein
LSTCLRERQSDNEELNEIILLGRYVILLQPIKGKEFLYFIGDLSYQNKKQAEVKRID